jgi:hypothetical protein
VARGYRDRCSAPFRIWRCPNPRSFLILWDTHSSGSRSVSEMSSKERQDRSPAVVTRVTSPSPSASRYDILAGTAVGRGSLQLGVCAMGFEARSKPMKQDPGGTRGPHVKIFGEWLNFRILNCRRAFSPRVPLPTYRCARRDSFLR